ncbi:hypothetical protein C8R45DRAFT_1093217 [Mycena sanguinolenta]|nr:hypothetical protein C8R45DRAFT_1093217 [Mycena sanguinolenta]
MSFLVSSNTTVHQSGRTVMYYIFGLVVQTFFFGAYTILIWMSTRMLLQRKLKARVNRVMFGITTFMYLLSLSYWAYSVADGVDRMHQYIALAVKPSLHVPDHTLVTQWSPLFNAVTLINYVLSDGVVVWRARIICAQNHRKYLWITMGFLAITSLAVAFIIVLRVVNLVMSPIDDLPKSNFLPHAIDILQVTTIVTSLLSNFTATGAVGVAAWGHWRIIRTTLGNKTSALRTNRILLLIVETGGIYCISAVMVLISSLIRLPHGTLGDLWTPIQVQFAGAYPCIVLLLVSTKKSLSEASFTDDEITTSRALEFSSVVSDISKPIHFARNPALSATDTVMDITSSRPPTEKFGQPQPLSDDSYV